MIDQQNVKSILSEIENGKLERDLGRTKITLIAMALSLLPIIGGAASIAFEKSGTELFAVDLENHLVTLAAELRKMGLRIDEIDGLSKRVDLISEAVATNSAIAEEFRKLIASAAKSASKAQIIDEHVVNNNGGIMIYTNVIMENLRLSSSAADGATTTFNNLTHSGSSKFDTDRARQEISNARFSGRGEGFSSFVQIQNGLFGQGSVETNVSEPGCNIGLRVTRVVGPNDPGGATLSISNLPKGRK